MNYDSPGNDVTDAPVDQYWATVPSDELAPQMNRLIEAFLNDLSISGRIDMWRRAIRLYYGYDAEGGWASSAALTFAGDNGETVMLRANQFRSLLRSMITMVTGTRPAFLARPKSADTTAQQEAELGEAILDFYISDYGLEDDMVDAAVYALLLGEGWMETRWDEHSGIPFDVETLAFPGQGEEIAKNEAAQSEYDMATETFRGQVDAAKEMGEDFSVFERPTDPELVEIETYEKIRYAGDLVFSALKPEDVIRDIHLEDPDKMQWCIVRSQKNRWDLIAQYPEHREAILNTINNAKRDAIRSRIRRVSKEDGMSNDLVDVYELWHEKCDALPRGRYALLIDTTVLVETEMPYDDLPVQSMIPSLEIDEPYGYGESWDLMALQQAYDATLNTIVTNHAAFGLQNIWAPPGSNLEIKDLGGGLKHVSSLHKPEAINLLPANSISIELMSTIQGIMQLISGINDVSRGEAAASQSGSALAMMASIAVQYNSSLQRAYGQMWEHVGTSIIRVFQRWASIPRTIEVAGKQKIPQIREVSGTDIENVNSITVDLGNPIMRTAAGRKEAADKLLQAKVLPDADAYLQVQATGRLEPIMNRPKAQATLIASENERLVTGQPVKCLITDNHAQHIGEHSTILDEPGTRYDDPVVMATDQHIAEHVFLWQNASPIILAATGQQPAPPPMGMGGMMPGQEPGAEQPPAPEAGGGGGPPAEPEQHGLSGGPNAGKEPVSPQMPQNPMSGVRPDAASGGMA